MNARCSKFGETGNSCICYCLSVSASPHLPEDAVSHLSQSNRCIDVHVPPRHRPPQKKVVRCTLDCETSNLSLQAVNFISNLKSRSSLAMPTTDALLMNLRSNR